MPIDFSSAYRLIGDQPEPEKLDRPGQFGKGFKAGIDQTQAMGGGLVAAFGDALGVDSLKEWGLSSYQRNMEEAHANQGNVQGFTDIEGFGDAIDWALYTAGNMAPMLATSMLGGGVGAIAAKKLATHAAGNIIRAEVAKGIPKNIAMQTAAKHLAKASKVGAGTGAYAASTGMETGSIYGESPDVEGRAGTAFAHGAVAGVLDVMPQMRLLKRLGVGKVAGDEIKDSVLKFAGKQIASEGITEGMQTVVEQHAQHWLDKNKEMFGPDQWKQIIDAAAAGGLMGGLSGGAAGFARRGPGESKVVAPDVVQPPTLGLPTPDQTAYVDPQGKARFDTAQPFVSPDVDPSRPDPLTGGPGMETEVARGEPAPLEGTFQSGQKPPIQEVATVQGDTFDVTPERDTLPAPDTMVVDKEGVAARGPTAPFIPGQPEGGKGMDQQAPTAKKSTDEFELSYKTNGTPFTTEKSAKLSKPFREASKAGKNPKVVTSGNGFAVQVQKTTKHGMRPQPTPKEVSVAAHEAATSPKNDIPEPTQGQKDAGNYKVGKVKLHGLDISIENPKGSLRKGVSPEGDAWSSKLHSHYGYIKRTLGADGDHVDVFIGDKTDSDQVFVIDQVNKDGSFDEHKIVMAELDEKAARDNYLKNYDKGWTGLGAMTQMSVDEFKTWLKNGNTKKPLSLKENKITEVPDAKAKKSAKPDDKESAKKESTKEKQEDAKAKTEVLKPASIKPLDKLMSEKAVEPALTIETKSDKTIIVKGAKPEHKPRLRALGGIWNANGWIYPKKKEAAIREALSDLLESAGQVADKPTPKPKKVEPTKPAAEVVSIPKKEQKPAPELEDFGEKLEGAKKHLAKSFEKEYSDDDIASLPLSKIWPKKELDEIEDTFTAAFATVARQEIPNKPKKSYKVARWVETVKRFRELMLMMFKIKGNELIKSKLDEISALTSFKAKVEILENIDRSNWDRVGKVSEYYDSYRFGEGSEKIPSPHISIEVDGRNHYVKAETLKNGMPEIKKLFDAPVESKTIKFEVRGRKGSYSINKKGDTEYRRLKTFTDLDEARKFLRENNSDLVAEWEAVKERDNVKKTDVRSKENRPRTGQDYRNGKDITPEEFSEKFGFRGVQFGNWVKQGGKGKDRQGMLNQAYDALMDLSNILGIPPKAISLEGSLGLAFGARGSGGASAHYEPGQVVINLTKTKGAGSLAHEWFHALDNYFSKKRGESKDRDDSWVTYKPEQLYVHKTKQSRPTSKANLKRYAEKTNASYYNIDNWKLDPAHKEGIRPEVEAHFADTVNALNESPMAARALAIDKGKKGYWSDIIERAARSFENYVIAKMNQDGYDNDYLANVRPISEFQRNRNRYPYLLDEELAPVSDAFDGLFGEIKTKETEEGIALFSRKTGDTKVDKVSISKADADKVINKVTFSWAGGRKNVVMVDTFDALPEKVKADAKSQGAEGQIYGVFHDGKIYLVRDMHKTPESLEKTIFHEAYGHYGLRSLFGKGIQKKMLAVYLAIGGSKGLVRYADKHNFKLSEYAKGLLSDGSITRDQAYSILTEELLAHMAQNAKPGIKSKVMELIGFIRQWLRDHGFKSFEKFNESDLMNLLNQSRKSVIKGGKPGGKHTSFMVAWHGTPHSFKKFSLGKIGTGEGAQVYGWGLYFAGKKSIGEYYRDILSKIAGTKDGKLYQVDIPEENQLLDHDKLLGEQPKEIQAALGKVKARLERKKVLDDYLGVINAEWNELTGKELYQIVKKSAEDAVLPVLPEEFERSVPHDEAASKYLDSLGIKGLQYLDGDSRGGAEGTRNYVIWDEDAVTVEAVNDQKQDQSDKAKFSIHHPSEAFDDLDQAQKDFYKKIGPKTIPERVTDRINQVTDRLGLKIKQGLVDHFAALKEIDKAARGENVVEQDTANSSWVLSRMSRAAGGALNALISHGRISMSDGVIDVDTSSDSLMDVLKKLGGSAEVERFMGWIAANRADKLMAEGKENLFTEDEIAAGMRANTGTLEDGRDRSQVYKDTFKEFQVIQDDVLKIAEESGIISDETRDLWKNEFYVPFYRVMDDKDVSGPQTVGGGLSRQYAYKKLKGGKQNINDLLENTMMNFEHLISASLKNQAASKAIENAEIVDVATETTEAARDKDASTFILKDGEKTWYNISDPLVFQSLTSMAGIGMNSTAMNIMRSFKRVFTNFVTASPQFMAANLIRDSFQAVALADMKKNPIANVIEGINSYGVFDKQKEGRAHLQATGGSFSFGHAYGEDSESLKIELNRMMRTGTIIEDGKDVLSLLKKGWEAYRGVSDSLENVNRAAVYDKAIADGKTKLQAAFEARDLMDFSSHGGWAATRFLIGVVPFLNARLQGLDKIYRSGVKPSGSVIRSLFPGADPATDTDKKAAARFAAVTGALTMATMALYLSNKDDEDYKKLEDWQKDTYWFIKAGDSGFFIPKPFEVGAIATLAERTLEQLVDDKATGKLFTERLGHMLLDTFSFNPTPQLFRPVIDVYANRDSFTGRQIETMGQKRLSPSLRTRAGTSSIAKVASKVTEETFGTLLGDDSSLVLSPVQIDYLIGGWLGWLGETAVASTDVAVKSMSGKDDPAKNWSEYQPFRRFYRDLSLPGYNKYQTEFYDNLREVSRIHADIRHYREAGEFEAARDLAIKNRRKLNYRLAMNRIQKRLSKLSNQAKVIKNSNASAEIKRRRLDMIQATKNKLTEIAAKRYK